VCSTCRANEKTEKKKAKTKKAKERKRRKTGTTTERREKEKKKKEKKRRITNRKKSCPVPMGEHDAMRYTRENDDVEELIERCSLRLSSYFFSGFLLQCMTIGKKTNKTHVAVNFEQQQR
jgi:hypothetical protein